MYGVHGLAEDLDRALGVGARYAGALHGALQRLAAQHLHPHGLGVDEARLDLGLGEGGVLQGRGRGGGRAAPAAGVRSAIANFQTTPTASMAQAAMRTRRETGRVGFWGSNSCITPPY